MTPAERSRQIDKAEFEAECKAARERALAYSKQCRKLEKQKVRAWMRDDADPITAKFVYSGRPPMTYTVNGHSRTLAQWASHLGISIHTLTNRRRRLGSFEAAVAMGGTTRSGREPIIVEFNGQSRPLSHWAAIAGLKADTIHHRLRSGWSIADALTTPAQRRRGVASNFEGSEGTGGGSTVQETPKITFSKKA